MMISFFIDERAYASAEIRGRQLAARLGAEVNPQSAKCNDALVFVKCFPPDTVLKQFPERVYFDVVDSYGFDSLIKTHPEVNILCIGKYQADVLRARYPKNKVVSIPEHHCNFELDVRKRTEVSVAGWIGYPDNFELDPQALKKRLNEVGMDFIWKTEFNNRKEVCDFYKTIDIQVTFRNNNLEWVKNPLKLINAGSFMIPSVCYPELNYVAEFPNEFLPAYNIDDVVYWCIRLKSDADFYNTIAYKAMLKSSGYHIDKIAARYLEEL